MRRISLIFLTSQLSFFQLLRLSLAKLSQIMESRVVLYQRFEGLDY